MSGRASQRRSLAQRCISSIVVRLLRSALSATCPRPRPRVTSSTHRPATPPRCMPWLARFCQARMPWGAAGRVLAGSTPGGSTLGVGWRAAAHARKQRAWWTWRRLVLPLGFQTSRNASPMFLFGAPLLNTHRALCLGPAGWGPLILR
eukprot:2588228-Rhodomonas_salina.1